MVAKFVNWIIKPILAVVIGQAAIQLAHLFGFYPDRLLAEGVYWLMTQTPSPEIIELFQWGLAAVIGLSVLGAYEFAKSRRNSPLVDADALVPLKEAATIAYEETRGTRIAEIAERMTDGDVLGYYAHALFGGDTTLYGKHPPSRKLEAVPKEEYGRCGFSNDYSALRRHGKSRNLYEGLQVKRSDIDRRIAELELAASAPHEVRLSDALHWIIDTSDWGSGLGLDSLLDQAAIILRQAAKDGEITVRGRRQIAGYHPDGQFDRTWGDIDRSYWETHEFEMTAVMDAEPHYATRETQTVSLVDNSAEAQPHYAMLRVWSNELEKRWPKANTSG